MSNVGWDLACEICSEHGITLDEGGCFLYGFMTELIFTPISSAGVSVSLTLFEGGPVLKLETTDGDRWEISRSWGSMSPFDRQTSWEALVPANKGDLEDGLLSSYPTRNEYAILMCSPEVELDTDDALLLLKLWVEFFVVDDALHREMTKNVRREMLNQEDEKSDPESEPMPAPKQANKRVLN